MVVFILPHLMNVEPFVGLFYKNPALLLSLVSDRIRLQPFYDRIFQSIREGDKKKLIFFEPINLSSLPKFGFSDVPGGKPQASKSVISWHYYYNPLPKDIYFSSRVSEARKLGAASFATEIDLSWDGTLNSNTEE